MRGGGGLCISVARFPSKFLYGDLCLPQLFEAKHPVSEIATMPAATGWAQQAGGSGGGGTATASAAAPITVASFCSRGP